MSAISKLRIQFFIFLIGHCFLLDAQTEESFLQSRGFLVEFMKDRPLNEFRSGPWQLSAVSIARFADSIPMNVAFDPREDLILSTRIAETYWNGLLTSLGDTSLADHALIYGPVQTRRMMMEDSALLRWKSIYKQMTNLESPEYPKTKDLMYVIEGPVDWQDIAGISFRHPEDFYKLNPAVRQKRLPEGSMALLRLKRSPNPKEIVMLHRKAALRDSIQLAELKIEREKRKKGIPDMATHDITVHRVRSGEYLGVIAQRYGVGVSEIKKWNSLSSDRINIGQELTIYTGKGRKVAADKTPEKKKPAPEVTVRTDEKDRKESIYEIQSGDTLWSIARNYPGVSAGDIMRWNGIDENIKIGQMIKILPPEKE